MRGLRSIGKLTFVIGFVSIHLIRMKKFLAVLTVVFILFLGVVGALSVIPHAHGNDFDHSKHQNCPVYQFSLHAFGAVPTVFKITAIVFFLFYLLRAQDSFSTDFSHRFSFLRDPPIAV